MGVIVVVVVGLIVVLVVMKIRVVVGYRWGQGSEFVIDIRF